MAWSDVKAFILPTTTELASRGEPGTAANNAAGAAKQAVNQVMAFGAMASGNPITAMNAPQLSINNNELAGAAALEIATVVAVRNPANVERAVIGRVKDLQRLAPGERSLLSRLPDKGSPKANWKQNSGVLRSEMKRGLPIRDASPGDTGGRFLNAERNLLQDRGWTFDSDTTLWMPP